MHLLLPLLLGCTPNQDSKINDGTGGTRSELTWVGELQPFCDMTLLGDVLLPGEFKTDVEVVGDLAYVPWGGNDLVNGLEVVDLTDPTNPTNVGHADTADWFPEKIEAGDGMVFIAHRWDGALVYDISNPTLPILRSQIVVEEDPATGWGVRVSDVAYKAPHLYIVGTHLEVHDLSDPANPVLAGIIPPNWDDTVPEDERWGELSDSIAIDGDIAWITDIEGRLISVDISDPTDPYILGSARWPGLPTSIAIRDGMAYLTDEHFGVRVGDVSDPNDPLRLDTLDTSGSPYSLSLNGDRLYVAASGHGVVSFDVSDPSSIELVGYAPMADGPWGVDVKDGLIVTATSPELRIFQDCDL